MMYSVLSCIICLSYTRSNRALADSLEWAMDPQDPLVNRLLRMMATQAMSNALYFSTGACPEEQYYHYGTCLSFTHCRLLHHAYKFHMFINSILFSCHV